MREANKAILHLPFRLVLRIACQFLKRMTVLLYTLEKYSTRAMDKDTGTNYMTKLVWGKAAKLRSLMAETFDPRTWRAILSGFAADIRSKGSRGSHVRRWRIGICA